MNTYTIDEIELIYRRCTSFDDVEQASKQFNWLLRNGFQEKSDALQLIALEALRKFI